MALKTATGVRYYPAPNDKKTSLLTKSRCIEHTEQALSKDYKSTMTHDIQDPRNHPQYHLQVRVNKGPRSKLVENQIKTAIASEFEMKKNIAYEASRHVTYSTTNNDTYDRPGFKPFL